VRAAPAEGRTVLLASHELERTSALVHREVVITTVQMHAARPEAAPPGAEVAATPGPAPAATAVKPDPQPDPQPEPAR